MTVHNPVSTVQADSSSGHPTEQKNTSGAAHIMQAGTYTLDTVAATAGNVVDSFTVPAGYPLQLLFGQVVLTTDATVANRQVVVGLYDGSGNLINDVHAGTVFTASLTAQHVELMQGVYRETTIITGTLQVPIPIDWIGQPGYTFRITISAGVAGDSYTAKMMYAQV